MTNAIREDDVEAVRELILTHPELLHEHARGVMGNWGPPMSYAANLGRDRIITMLRDLGADDLAHAFDRACLQGKLESARLLYAMGARPAPDAVMGPCETLNGAGLRFLLELGAQLSLDAVALLLQTYSRNPPGKHECLELTAARLPLPDTPAMAVHRGRIDLLEPHLARDPGLFGRQLTHEDIYPPSLGCSTDPSLALHGTPLAGGTLLHMTVDFDEIELARWMLDRGADPNAPAAIDADGFGGQTAIYGAVVSQAWRSGPRKDAAFAELLLERGARTEVRASLRKRLRFVEDETEHVYRDVTPVEWGERFHDRAWVSEPVMRRLGAAGRGSATGGP